MDYGGKPLDGVSQVEALWSKIDEKYEVRDEILQYINPYERIFNISSTNFLVYFQNQGRTSDLLSGETVFKCCKVDCKFC